MRDLNEQEIESYLDDNGEAEEGCTAVETTIGELARLGVGTCCGHVGNHAFVALDAAGMSDRRVIGWYDKDAKEVVGMINIEVVSEEDDWKISDIAGDNGGSLRPNGEAYGLDGFYEFEIE